MFHRVKSETSNPAEESETSMNTPKTNRPYDPASEGYAAGEGASTSRPQANASQASSAPAQSEQPAERPAAREFSPETTAAPTQKSAPGYGSAFTPRTPQASAPRAPGYGASYPGAAGYKIPSAATAPQNGEKDRTLTIGAGITMSGEIECCDYLLVEGTVEAALKGARTLEIAESGTFYGTVEIGEATIAGRFEGDITVHGRLTITSTGSITGTIAYKELEIEAGAVIDGRLTPVTGSNFQENAQEATKSKSAPNKGRSKASERGEQQPANAGGGLFSASAAAE